MLIRNFCKIPRAAIIVIIVLYLAASIVVFILSNSTSNNDFYLFMTNEANNEIVLHSIMKHKNTARMKLVFSQEIEIDAENYDDNAIYQLINNEQALNNDGGNINDSILEEESHKGKMFPEFSKFIFTPAMCAGLGNQMFRFASLYGIGKTIGRTPFYLNTEFCIREFEQEIRDIFPNYYKRIYFYMMPAENLEHHVLFTQHCCKFDPNLMRSGINEKALEIQGGTLLQSFNYFHSFRDEIRELFQCSITVMEKLEEYKTVLFSSEKKNSYNICVHTRVGDFMPLKLSTNTNYTSLAISYILNEKKQKFPTKEFAVLLLGEDKQFLQNIKNINEEKIDVFANFFVPKPMKRGEDLCFAYNYCDTLLITTHASTYSFWIGYLMHKDADIYYNPNFIPASPYSDENFPPEWKPLQLIDSNKKLFSTKRKIKYFPKFFSIFS